MYALEKISTGTTREAGHQPDGTEYPAWSGQDGKNYGSERGCNSFLNVSFVPIAPQSVTREDHDGISHNLTRRRITSSCVILISAMPDC